MKQIWHRQGQASKDVQTGGKHIDDAAARDAVRAKQRPSTRKTLPTAPVSGFSAMPADFAA
eukprot:324269-Chlamydomonas_euryale.AAC.1